MGAGRHGQGGGHLPLGNVEECFFAVNLSKTSLDEVFMHQFEKMSSASGGLASRPPPGSYPLTLLGDFRPSDPSHCPPLEKILAHGAWRERNWLHQQLGDGCRILLKSGLRIQCGSAGAAEFLKSTSSKSRMADGPQIFNL